MQPILFISLKPHHLFGVVPKAYLGDFNPENNRIENLKNLYSREVVISENLSTPLKEIALNCTDFNEENLYKTFCNKKLDKASYFKTLPQEVIDQDYKPYFARRYKVILKNAKETGTPFYKKYHKSEVLYPEDKYKLSTNPAEVVFYVDKFENETRYKLQIQIGDKELSLLNKKPVFLSLQPCILILDNHLIYFKEGEDDINGKLLNPFFRQEFISIKKELETAFYSGFLKRILQKHKVVTSGIEVREEQPSCWAELSLKADLKFRPHFSLDFRYENYKNIPYNAVHHPSITFLPERMGFRKIIRDIPYEQDTAGFLIEQGLHHVGNSLFHPSPDESLPDIRPLLLWLAEHKKLIEEKGIGVDTKWDFKNYLLAIPRIELDCTAKQDWFDLKIVVQFGEFLIPFFQLRDHILQHISEYTLPNGEVALIPEEWFATYRNLMLFGEGRRDQIRLKKSYFHLLNELIPPSTDSGRPDFKDIERITSKNSLLPVLLKADLRPYQETGFRWLQFLRQQGFGGCLADDMGLGKTLQTLALITKIKESYLNGNRGSSHTRRTGKQLDLFENGQVTPIDSPSSLIVCPTSLVHNWILEIKKFAPHLRYFEYSGPIRVHMGHPLDFFPQYDVILTSYGIARNDIEVLKAFPFELVVLDESQYIKNPFSKIYQAVIQLEARQRIVLTGTPIENNLGDLWAQMNFVNRGYLGSMAFFRERFELPIDKGNDPKASELLNELIRPFILRRSKREVAPELPELTEQTIYCEMTAEQESIYEREKSRVRNLILEQISQAGIEKSAFLILKGLTMLRQIASHPKLIDPGYTESSGKFEEVIRALDTVIGEGHKVLIFSPFVRHLQLLANYLKQKEIEFSMLTGQSRNRSQIVDEFRTSQHIRIFLISIKAGGTGLNLPEADYVFILDPWWNPAVEDQAISRSHRIGQSTKVFAYRFITSGSIEEKISLLQEKKTKLADAFINSNNPFKRMETATLKELLS